MFCVRISSFCRFKRLFVLGSIGKHILTFKFCCHLFKRIFLKTLSKYQLVMVASNACSLSVYNVETPRGFLKIFMNHSIRFRSQKSQRMDEF